MKKVFLDYLLSCDLNAWLIDDFQIETNHSVDEVISTFFIEAYPSPIFEHEIDTYCDDFDLIDIFHNEMQLNGYESSVRLVTILCPKSDK